MNKKNSILKRSKFLLAALALLFITAMMEASEGVIVRIPMAPELSSTSPILR